MWNHESIKINADDMVSFWQDHHVRAVHRGMIYRTWHCPVVDFHRLITMIMLKKLHLLSVSVSRISQFFKIFLPDLVDTSPYELYICDITNRVLHEVCLDVFEHYLRRFFHHGSAKLLGYLFPILIQESQHCVT